MRLHWHRSFVLLALAASLARAALQSSPVALGAADSHMRRITRLSRRRMQEAATAVSFALALNVD